MIPVILAVFANDERQSLSLREEKKALQKVFNDSSQVELKILENADFDDVNNTVIREQLKERIIAFHYAGHSDGRNIRLIDGNTTAQGLAKFLKSLTHLQLVFMNGCDSYDQTEAIQGEGVTAAVLTTLRPLNDEVAVLFADYFYFAFYHRNSLNASFLSAEARIVGNPDLGKHRFTKLLRSIGFDSANLNRDVFEGKTVYVLTEPEKDYLKRTLLFNIHYTPPPPAPYQYVPNRQLIASLSESILTGQYINEAFKESFEYAAFDNSYQAWTKAPDNNRLFGQLALNILLLLPFPLSYHLYLLRQKEKEWANLADQQKKDFLERQVIMYNSIVQLLGFTLLSSLWYELAKHNVQELQPEGNGVNGGSVAQDKSRELKVRQSQWEAVADFMRSAEATHQEYPDSIKAVFREIYEANKFEVGEFLIEDHQWDVIRGFANADQMNSQEINYPALIITIRKIFEANHHKPFIKEYLNLREIYKHEDDFFNVHLHMQGVKASIANGEISKLNVDRLCYDTEKMLSEILSKAGFIIRYKLTTVKNIEFAKRRLGNPRYSIQHIVLDGQEVNLDDILEHSKYTDSFSMILARGTDPETFTDFMTLSPFIIDRNAFFEAKGSTPFFFSHRTTDGYVYLNCQNPAEPLTVKDNTYPVNPEDPHCPNIKINRRLKAIKDEMDEFTKLVNA